MKINKYNSIFLVMLIALTGVFSSCADDEDVLQSKSAKIHYVRLVNPEKADSVLTAGFLANRIAIMGENLGGVTEVWFNDQQAELLPTFVTNSSIITVIPEKTPEVVNNKIAVVFGIGDTLFYDFPIEINAPLVSSMVSEYVQVGEVATIRGNFFFEPIKVTFAGGVEGIVASPVKDPRVLEVIVPEGAETGPITVTTNFGETVSAFWLYDNRNIFFGMDNDPFVGWWGKDLIVDATDPLSINGNFGRFTGSVGNWGWTELFGGPKSSIGALTKEFVPEDAIINPSAYNFKFEVNTIKPFNGNAIKILFGHVAEPDPVWDAINPYQWMPPLDTEGKWQTITVSFDAIVEPGLAVSEDGYGFKFWFLGAGELNADMAFDNFRVVPKE